MARNKKAANIPYNSLGAPQILNVHLRMIQEQGPSRTTTNAAHRDDYYIFLFQLEGESRLMVDFTEVILTGPCIYYILPGQVHHYISTHGVSGWLLATEPLSIDDEYRQLFEEALGEASPVIPDGSAQQRLDNCLHVLGGQLQQPREDLLGNAVLSHLVAACAGMFAAIFLAAEKKRVNTKDRPTIITQQFRKLVKKNYVIEKSPAAYAALLNLSLAYLNECVKEVTGKPVGYWIQHEILLEAKRLLAYTTLSIKEIAYKLGYDDHTYFSRLFNKATDTTAARFRKDYHR